MVARPVIHVSAVAAVLFLAATWSASAPAFEAPRAVALFLVLFYLIFVLASICSRGTPQLHDWHGDLWDAELDNRLAGSSPTEMLFLDDEPELDWDIVGELILESESPGRILVQFCNITALNRSSDRLGGMRDAFRDLESYQQVVIDFEGVEFRPDAIFLAMLIRLQRRLQRHDGELILTGLSYLTLECLRSTNIGEFFHLEGPSVYGMTSTNTLD